MVTKATERRYLLQSVSDAMTDSGATNLHLVYRPAQSATAGFQCPDCERHQVVHLEITERGYIAWCCRPIAGCLEHAPYNHPACTDCLLPSK